MATGLVSAVALDATPLTTRLNVLAEDRRAERPAVRAARPCSPRRPRSSPGRPSSSPRPHPSHARSRGQSLVELALILPVLLLLALAALDLGRLFYAQITLTNAAREGAMEASLNPTSFVAGSACNAASNRIMCATVGEAANSFVTVAPADVQRQCSPACAKAANTTVTVTVTGRFRLITPAIEVFTGGRDLRLASTATADVVMLPPVAARAPASAQP